MFTGFLILAPGLREGLYVYGIHGASSVIQRTSTLSYVEFES